jgi:hypothetical protein
VVATLAPGNYTAQIANAASTPSTGITLVEVYDGNTLPADRRLLNISSRAIAGPDHRTLIAGFVIAGTTPTTVLIRAAGPALVSYGVPGVLADPTLAVVDLSGVRLAVNDDWSAATNKSALSTAAAQVGAFAFADPSKDSAVLLTLAPGNYTALVNGANGTSGVALVEVYEVP